MQRGRQLFVRTVEIERAIVPTPMNTLEQVWYVASEW